MGRNMKRLAAVTAMLLITVSSVLIVLGFVAPSMEISVRNDHLL